MKISFALVFILACSTVSVKATHPILDFIGSVLNDSETLTNWAGEESSQPNGGYLYKFEYDIDSDGKSDLFLSSSISRCDKSCSWTVYIQNQNGTYTKVGNGMLIAPEPGFLSTQSPSGRPQIVTTFIVGTDSGITDIQELSVQGSLVLTRQQLDKDQIANYKGNQNGTKVKPAVKKVLLAEYLKVQSPQWRSYDKNFGPTAQQNDPADANALSYADDFMFEDAQSLLQTRLTL